MSEQEIWAKASFPDAPKPDEHERHLARIDPAWGACAYSLRTGDRIGHAGRRGQSLVEVATDLEARRKQFKDGDTLALLQAIDQCAQENLPLPTWLALAFQQTLDRFVGVASQNPVKTLDEAFRSSHMPTSEKGAARARADWQLGAQLWSDVRRVASDFGGLDPALDHVLATKNWGVRKTTARRLVKMIDESQSQLTSDRIKPLSRIWRRSRKRVTEE